MAEFRPATPDQAEFLGELLAAGLLIDSGVPGVYGRGEVFERIRLALRRPGHARRRPTTAPSGCAFPPLLPRRQLEEIGYLKSFPHLAGTIFAFDGDEEQAPSRRSAPSATRTGASSRTMTDLVLTPAACYPVYPAIAARGPLAPGGVIVDAGGSYVFRHEPSGDPARLQMFHQREIVRIGEPETVAAWRDRWRDRAVELLRAVGLDADFDVANDPFFGRSGRLLAAQPARAGAEVRDPGPDRRPRADRGRLVQLPPGPLLLDLRDRDGRRRRAAHTACLGFGLERITLALLRTHGLDPDAWPARRARGAGAAMSTATGTVSLLGLDPATYEPHALHGSDRTYTETNCYTDILIEFVHARGDEPLAMMGCVLPVDFEGDQWTFFKPRPEDLERALRRRHPRDAALPPAARADRRADPGGADDHRRARLLVPARHRGDQLPPRARQELRRRRGDRPRRRAPALLPRPRLLRARGRGLPRRLPARPRALRRRPAALHRARALRRRPAPGGRGAARGGARAARPAPRPAPGDQPVRALRRAADARPAAACSRATPPPTTTTPSRRCAWSARPSRSALRTSSWLLGDGPPRPRRRWARSSTAARRSPSSSPAGASSIPARRSRPSPPPGRRASRSWTMSSDEPSHPGLTPARLRIASHDRVDLDDGWEVASCAPDACEDPAASRRARLAAGDGARDRGGGAARRRPLAAGGRARLRRRGLVVSDQLRGRAGRARGGGRALPRRHRDGRRGLPQRRADPRGASMFAAHAIDVGARLRAGAQRAGDPLPALAPLLRAAASRARAGAPGSPTTACASSARCCSAAPPASRRARRRSDPGGRSRSSAGEASRCAGSKPFPAPMESEGVLTTRGWLRPLAGVDAGSRRRGADRPGRRPPGRARAAPERRGGRSRS